MFSLSCGVLLYATVSDVTFPFFIKRWGRQIFILNIHLDRFAKYRRKVSFFHCYMESPLSKEGKEFDLEMNYQEEKHKNALLGISDEFVHTKTILYCT